MRIGNLNYVKPQSLGEACAFLAEHGQSATVLAGGSDVLVSLKQKRVTPEIIIDIRGLDELGQVDFADDNSLRIGSLVTVDRVASDGRIQQTFPGLAEAALSIGAVQHRTMGTVGGNICLDTRCWFFNQALSWRKARPVCTKLGGDVCHVVNKGGGVCYAAFSADLATALVAMDAEVVLCSKSGERTVPLHEFYTGDGVRPNIRRPDEIIRELKISASPDTVKSAYVKRRVRDAIDFGQAGVAIALWLDKKTSAIKKARLVLSCLGTSPLRVPDAEAMLLTGEITEKVLQEIQRAASGVAKPVKNVYGASVSYRKKMAGVLAVEGIERLLNLHEGNRTLETDRG